VSTNIDNIRPIEYGKDYDVVNNPDKFQLYIDGKEIK
jgi:hypothetical protein